MSELSAIELEAGLRREALDLAIRSFGRRLDSQETKLVTKRARKFFDFLSGQDVNGLVDQVAAAQATADSAQAAANIAQVTADNAAAAVKKAGNADVLKDFVEVSAPGYDSSDEFSHFGTARYAGEPVLDWLKRITPAGAEYPIVSTGTAIELLVAVSQDEGLELEIYQNPGRKTGWGISALSRVI